jgi:hypothetical protein
MRQRDKQPVGNLTITPANRASFIEKLGNCWPSCSESRRPD